MPRYARGDRALGECARSGRVMRLNELVHDGLYPNLLVDPAWYEPPYPCRDPRPIIDPIALREPSPRRDSEVLCYFVTWDGRPVVTRNANLVTPFIGVRP